MNNGIHTVNIDTPIGNWVLSTLAPPADLADIVQSFWAVRGRADYGCEAILPSAKVELMFNLGEEFRVTDTFVQSSAIQRSKMAK